MKNIALLLASGSGKRCGLDYPKQFALIGNKTILEISVETFQNHKLIDEIILVTSQDYVERVAELTKKYSKVSKVIVGGETRKDSSYNGISSIKEEQGNVLIHDAVRPLVSDQIISSCIEGLDRYNAVCVAIPSTDTILMVDDEKNITNIPPRKFLYRAQTPQCFKLSLIKDAHKKAALDYKCSVTDDCGLVINYTDEKIHIISGSEDNIKVTYKEDIEFVKKQIETK